MKKLLLLVVCVFFTHTTFSQEIKSIYTDIFEVIYSEIYQQPLQVMYNVECPTGDVSRRGMDFKKYEGVITSDNEDYKDNIWDKGHIAPAADFNCDEEKLRGTFSYLNCALQHQGLNRGPWKELERFERDLSKVYAFVNVTVTIHFEDKPENWLPTGALVPIGFTKIIWCDGEKFSFYFPNRDVSGQDWSLFKID